MLQTPQQKLSLTARIRPVVPTIPFSALALERAYQESRSYILQII